MKCFKLFSVYIFLFLFVTFSNNSFCQDLSIAKANRNFHSVSNQYLNNFDAARNNIGFNPLEVERVDAKRTCYCVVSYKNLTNQKKRSGVCLDLTGRVGHQYNGMSPHNQKACNKRCTDVAKVLSSSDLNKIANCACSKGVKNNTDITAYSALSVKKYKTAHAIGRLVNKPASYNTTCNCPKGWTYDKPNNKCKKAQCKLNDLSSNQPLGEWGFIWNGTIWQ